VENRSDFFENWIERKKIRLAFLIFAASLLIRGIYFLELRNTPTFHITSFPQTDMNFFDKWAKVILSGDLLTDRDLHPHHPWNLQIAPRENWNRWYGHHIFHQEPLYPYFLALAYRLFGEKTFAIFWIQFLFGSLANVLLFLAGARYFSPKAGLATGSLATFYGLSPFFEGGLLRAAPGFFLNALLLFLIASNLERDGWRRWLLLGLLFGISYLLRSTIIIFLILFVLYIFIRKRKEIRKALERTAPLLIGFTLMLIPLIARNVAVGASPLSVTSLAAVDFANANAPDKRAPGFWTSKYCKKILSASNGEFWATVRETLRVHKDVVGSYRRLAIKMWKEFLFFWRWPEISDNYSYYYARQDSIILKPMLTYGMISALGIAGMILSFGRARSWGVPLLLVATYALVSVIFCENSRLRHPAAAGLLLFAGAALAAVPPWREFRAPPEKGASFFPLPPSPSPSSWSTAVPASANRKILSEGSTRSGG